MEPDFYIKKIKVSKFVYDSYTANSYKINPEHYSSKVHNARHVERVLLLLLIISEHENIPPKMLDLAILSAIYHDIGRDNDFKDDTHGQKSYKRALKLGLIKHNDILKFLIENHCIDDRVAYRNLNNYNIKEDKNIAIKLLQILKDADMDRVRIGDFDENYLRLDISKGLIGTAYNLYEYDSKRLHM